MKIDQVQWYHISAKKWFAVGNIVSWPTRKEPYYYKSGYSGKLNSKRAWIVSPYLSTPHDGRLIDTCFLGEYSYYFSICATAYRTYEDLGYYLWDEGINGSSYAYFHYHSSKTNKDVYFNTGSEGEQLLTTLNKHKNSENIETRLNDLKQQRTNLENQLS